MSLVDNLRLSASQTKFGPECTLAGLTAEETDQLVDARRRRVTFREIASILNEDERFAGMRSFTVARHMRQECQCWSAV